MGLLSSVGNTVGGLLGKQVMGIPVGAMLGIPQSEEHLRTMLAGGPEKMAELERIRRQQQMEELQLKSAQMQMEQAQKAQGKDDITSAMIQSMNLQVADAVQRLRSSLASNDMAGAQKARNELDQLQSPEYQNLLRGHLATQGNLQMAEQAGMVAPLQQPMAPTNKMREYEFARQNGFEGPFTDFVQMSGANGSQASSFAPTYFQDKKTGRWIAVQANNQGGPPTQFEMPEGFTPQSNSLPPSGTNRLIEAKLDAAQQANQIVQKVQMAREQLAQIPDNEWNAGFRGEAAEAWKRATGMQDAQSLAKAQYTDLRNSGILNSLPPGVASDRDVALVLEGTLPANAPKAMILQYMAGLEKIASIRAQYSSFIADYVSSDPWRGMQGAPQAWKQYTEQMGGMPAAPIPNSSPAQGNRDLSTFSEEELRAELERIKRGGQ